MRIFLLKRIFFQFPSQYSCVTSSSSRSAFPASLEYIQLPVITFWVHFLWNAALFITFSPFNDFNFCWHHNRKFLPIYWQCRVPKLFHGQPSLGKVMVTTNEWQNPYFDKYIHKHKRGDDRCYQMRKPILRSLTKQVMTQKFALSYNTKGLIFWDKAVPHNPDNRVFQQPHVLYKML